MIRTIEDFYAAAGKFVDLFNCFVDRHGIEEISKADHICYKCGSTESFEYLRALLEPHSLFIYQSVISNRRIAYIRLKKGISTSINRLDFLELSDQRTDGSQREGYDHIEIYPYAASYSDLVTKLARQAQVIKVERPHQITNEVQLLDGFHIKCATAPLLEKIKNLEMAYDVPSYDVGEKTGPLRYMSDNHSAPPAR